MRGDESHLLSKDTKWYSEKTQKTYTILAFATNAMSGERCVMYSDNKTTFMLPVAKFLEGFSYTPPPPVVRSTPD